MSLVAPLDDAGFAAAVADGAVVVAFGAPWCAPCRTLAPVLDALAKARPRVRVRHVDIDASPAAPSRLGVRGIPHLVLFVGGEPRLTHTGASPIATLLSWLDAGLTQPKGK